MLGTAYNFYFDETYHDKKITLRNNKLNILEDSTMDDYIGFFWGTKEAKIEGIKNNLVKIEDKYRALFTLPAEQELKSRSFKNSQFKYGAHSLNQITLSFYNELFKICIQNKLIFQIEIISKMEILVRHIFQDVQWFRENGVFYDAFIYSFTKMLVYYNNDSLIMALCNLDTASESSRSILIHTISSVISADKGVSRKIREIDAFKMLLNIMNMPGMQINASNKLEWIHFANFDGLCKLLKELSINPKRINLFIDMEDSTVNTAQKYPFRNSTGVVSDENIEVRLSDWLAGFVGKVIWGLTHNPSAVEEKVTNIENIKNCDFSRKRVISTNWFSLKQQEFECYKNAANCFITLQPHYWAIMNCAYADHAILFVTLLKYINQYNFSDFSKISAERHRDNFEKICLSEIHYSYGSMQENL